MSLVGRKIPQPVRDRCAPHARVGTPAPLPRCQSGRYPWRSFSERQAANEETRFSRTRTRDDDGRCRQRLCTGPSGVRRAAAGARDGDANRRQAGRRPPDGFHARSRASRQESVIRGPAGARAAADEGPSPDRPVDLRCRRRRPRGSSQDHHHHQRRFGRGHGEAAIEADGYKGAKVLRQGANGIWYAKAMRGTTEVSLTIDATGRVSLE